ncbi:hypothetical protein FRC04_007565 [Tulasnella sp. 424]|nr:hypothetical protein FRC04_007565 [Tulasnella sp. 424]KAG8979000.1 hypothetical protein FRC05_009210 [Tulasnella sp. 425]
MSSRYTSQYTQGTAIPNIDEDRASRRSSRTSYSQQSSLYSPSLSTNRTDYTSSSSGFSSPASSSRTSYNYGSQRPSYVSQTSFVAARQQRPNPSPAYSISSYQASIVEPGEALPKDNFGRVTAAPATYPIAPAPAQPYPSQYQYQQQPANANPPTQDLSPKGLKRLFSGLNLNRRGSKASADGFSARSPPPTSGGGLAMAASDRPSRQDPVPRSSRKAQPQPKSPNVGSYLQHGRLAGEPPLPPPHQEFGQY